MRFFILSFAAALRRRLLDWRTWALALLLPLTVLAALRLLPAEEVSAPVRVGVVLPAQGGEDFYRRLEARSGLAVAFMEADRSRAERQVASGRWDCALVIPEGFEGRIARQDTRGLFTLLTGPGSTACPLVRETVAACAAECLAPVIAGDCLLENGVVDEAALAAAQDRLRQALGDEDRVLLSLETVDGGPLDPLALAEGGVSTLLAGVTAVLLLAWSLFAAMDLGRWLDGPAARRMAPLRGRAALLLPRLAAAMLPPLASGTAALWALDGAAHSPAALAAYLLFCGGAALALALVPPLWQALPALTPFVPVAGLLLSPALADTSALFPALAPLIRWTPVTLFLRAWGGAWTDALALALAGLLLTALCLVSDRGAAG